MKCTKCTFELPDDAKFCTGCGTPTASTKACGSCGAENPIFAQFCAGCGKSVVDKVPASKDVNAPALDDFIFLLDEESVKVKALAAVSQPWGYLGIVLKGGVASEQASHALRQEIIAQRSSKQPPEGIWGKLLAWVSKPFEGQGNLDDVYKTEVEKVTTRSDFQAFFVMDARNIPVITYARPLPLPGSPSAKLDFSFWLDLPEWVQVPGKTESESRLSQQKSLGIFFNRCLGQRKSLTTREFREIAIEQVEKVLHSINLESLNSDPASAKLIANELYKLCGISASCRLVRGKVGERIQFDVSKSAVSVTCPNTDCGTIFSSSMKFCDQCGTTLPKVESDYLVSKDGEQITLRLSLLVDRSYEINVIESQVANEVIKHLAPEIRNLTMAELTEQSALESLTKKLSAHLTQQFRSYLTEFNIIDIRSTAEDWFFKTDVLIREELRKLEADKQRLAVDDAEINLEEAAFAVAMRRTRFEYDAELEEDQARYNAEFKQRKVLLEDRLRNVEIEAESDLRVKEIETKRDLASEKIDDEADKTRLERESARRDLERSIDKKEAKNEREDEVEGLAHDQSLEKKMAAHDIDLADMTGEAESRAKRREVGDQSFEEEEQIRLRAKAEEEQIRLQAKALQDVGGAEENLEDRRQARKNDELRVLADIEANMEKRENEFKLSKIDSMKGLSAQELLAMQAAELAKAAGGGDATANLIKSIADSQAASAGAGIKDDMYKQMLEIQRQASESAIQAHKEASATAVGAHKEAAATSQSVNEKSMEMMSKVAEKAAGAVDTKLSIVTKLGNMETEKEAKPKVAKCIAPECDATWPAEVKKPFCMKCGASQQSTQ